VVECQVRSLVIRAKRIFRGSRLFGREELGLVAVEWVALTGGMVIAAVAISYVVMNNTKKSGNTVGAGISTAVTAKFGNLGSKI